ncbi:MAG TPA: AAA family ATPase [Pelobium sp.]|nr:AAA family ATPase [Pelobium sp.]
MSDFKLIGIRPITKCDPKICKVIKVGVPYIFYNQYDFSGYSDHNRKVLMRPNEIPDIYSFTKSNGEKLTINISALVGENGSGKSSLIELFYVACYNIAILANVLFDEEAQIRLGVKFLVPNVNVELFYQLNDKLTLLRLHGKSISFYKHENELFSLDKTHELNLNSFFYTISINYSLHALNSDVLGIWVKKIFHKNDGYQTPIVLNPYRDRGNIEINNEEYLVKSRLLSNILGKVSRRRTPKESLRNIINDKIANRLLVTINEKKFKYNEDGTPNFELTAKYGDVILPAVYEHFLKNKNFKPKETRLNAYAKEYIIRKLINIASKYDPYKKLFQFFYEPGGDLEGYLLMLIGDKSHVTFKLLQALNFLSNELYIDRKESFDLTVSYLSGQLNKQAELKNKELIDILPPGFFKIDIEFKDKGNFEDLSSGEKQRVYSIATLVYHLYNLNSTNRQRVNIKYQVTNIVFDELELYFHPEMQRTLVNDILSNLKRMELLDITGINVLFITHSPFILSDIPSQNMLALCKDGTPDKEGLQLQTFGANIFDLLKHSFFLKKGPMGEIAQETINKTIDWLNDNKRKLSEMAYHRQLIGLIGEPVLQLKLAEMFDEITGDKTEEGIIISRMAALQSDLNRVQNKDVRS